MTRWSLCGTLVPVLSCEAGMQQVNFGGMLPGPVATLFVHSAGHRRGAGMVASVRVAGLHSA